VAEQRALIDPHVRRSANLLAGLPSVFRIAAIAVASLTACSFDYAAGTADELLDQVADSVLSNVTHVVVRDGVVIAELRSATVKNYSADNRAVLTDVFYLEFDRDGAITNEGHADRAVISTETDDAEVSGAISLRSESQETEVIAEALLWEDGARRLTSEPDQRVELRRDDGSSVAGSGFEAEVRRRTIRFTGRVAGTIVVDAE
jgi:LPS export ABC transporter protein LptC